MRNPNQQRLCDLRCLDRSSCIDCGKISIQAIYVLIMDALIETVGASDQPLYAIIVAKLKFFFVVSCMSHKRSFIYKAWLSSFD